MSKRFDKVTEEDESSHIMAQSTSTTADNGQEVRRNYKPRADEIYKDALAFKKLLLLLAERTSLSFS
jgi:hypothetical protein